MMQHGEHVSEERLVLYFFDECEDAASVEKHLRECAACRADLEAVKRTMNLMDGMAVPERGEEYGAEVWRRVQPQLGLKSKSGWAQWFGWRQLALSGALAGLVVAAFMAGRKFPERSEQTSVVAQRQESATENRLLLVTVGDHLEQTQRMLIELSNSDARELPMERESASDLLAANRLYRQTASQSGDQGMSTVLEELESYLLEAAHSTPEQLKDLQRRMADEDILFRLRVMNAQLKQKQRKVLPVQSN